MTTLPDLLSTEASRPRLLHVLAALATGGLLSFMVLCNAEVTRNAGPVLGSLVPHVTGTLVAAAILAFLARRPSVASAPPWAYLGGLSGAVTVMFSSMAANTTLALSGTLALGLVGQAAFGLVADSIGLLGLQRRPPSLRNLTAISLILAGSAILIFGPAP